MALYVWKCGSCGKVTKKLLPARPDLGECDESVPCGTEERTMGYTRCDGELQFISNTASQTMEVIDNGLMAKVLERPANIEEKMAERIAHAEKADDSVI
jgi:hypothetical protein